MANMGELSNQLDDLISGLGLQKLSAAGGGEGESAGVIADPGTTQPAGQEAARSNIEPAKDGSQAADLKKFQKEEIAGQSTAEATPSDADNPGAASSSENVTTATTVGDNPKVEDGYGSKQQTLDAPPTESPADPNKDPEKYSADLLASATFIDKEIVKMAAVKSAEGGEKPKEGEEKAAAEAPKGITAASEGAKKSEEGEEKNAAEGGETIGQRIGELVLGKEASQEDKDAAVRDTVDQFLQGFAKTSALVGEMTADALTEFSKKAVGLEGEGVIAPEELAAGGAAEMAPAEGVPAEGVPAEGVPAEGAGMPGAEGAGADEAAQALAAAAQQIAQELGITPEEVLEAAAQELAVGGAGAEGGLPPEAVAGALPPEAAAGGTPPGAIGGEEALDAEEEKIASAELKTLREKAAKLDQIDVDADKAEKKAELAKLVTDAVDAALVSAAEKHNSKVTA